MASIFDPPSRHVVPGFRSFVDTALLGELGGEMLALPPPLAFDMGSVLAAWEQRRTVGIAGDLLSVATVSGQWPVQATEAAEFVLRHEDLAPPALVNIALSATRGTSDGTTSAEALPRLSTFLDTHSEEYIRGRIRELRHAVSLFPRDPILFVELARLYSITGNQEKAGSNMRAALALAPCNRFVLRSAARMLAHHGEAERAHNLLSRNPRTPGDPWLLSAEIALGGIVGRQSRLLKRATRIVQASDYSPLSLTELSSGLGTIELLEGRRKRSKELFRRALLRPNDNSLAQVEWAFSIDRLFDLDPRLFRVRRSYEALALDAFLRKDWRQAIEQCEAWFMDMPFSKRPIMMGAHVATIALEDYPTAQLFCRAGLVAHPRNPQLINNYAYALALEGKTADAFSQLERVPIATVDDMNTRVCLVATRGLVHFRRREIELGRRLYREAIAMARKLPNPSYCQLAEVNYAREEILARQDVADLAVERLQRMKVDPLAVTLGMLRDRVLTLFEEWQAERA